MTQPTQQTPVSHTVLTQERFEETVKMLQEGVGYFVPDEVAMVNAHNAELCRLLRRVDYVFDVLDKCEYFWEVDKNLIAEVWQELRTKAAPVFQEPSSNDDDTPSDMGVWAREFGWGQEDEKGVG